MSFSCHSMFSESIKTIFGSQPNYNFSRLRHILLNMYSPIGMPSKAEADRKFEPEFEFE